MFSAMFNNTSRIKYSAYFISLLFNLDQDKVLNNIELVKNKINIINIYLPIYVKQKKEQENKVIVVAKMMV